MVREFREEKYLSTSKDISKITKIDDIDNVVVCEHTSRFDDATVIGVLKLEKCIRCLNCSAKVSENDVTFGSCTNPKCKMVQSLNLCRHDLSTKIMVNTATSYFTLQAFGKVVSDIAGKNEDIQPEDLLKAAPFSLTHRNGLIISATRH